MLREIKTGKELKRETNVGVETRQTTKVAMVMRKSEVKIQGRRSEEERTHLEGLHEAHCIVEISRVGKSTNRLEAVTNTSIEHTGRGHIRWTEHIAKRGDTHPHPRIHPEAHHKSTKDTSIDPSTELMLQSM